MQSTNESKYKRYLIIDPHRLDEEWMNQPGLYMFWSEKAQKARAVADKAKFELEKLEAVVAQEIRKKPSKYGLDKITETGIRNAVLLDPRIQSATFGLIDLRTKADVLAKFVTALEQRKKALENLVYLTAQGYYSAPEKRKRRGVRTQNGSV